MVNIQSFSESSGEQKYGMGGKKGTRIEKSIMSDYGPFGDNYHICLS